MNIKEAKEINTRSGFNPATRRHFLGIYRTSEINEVVPFDAAFIFQDSADYVKIKNHMPLLKYVEGNCNIDWKASVPELTNISGRCNVHKDACLPDLFYASGDLSLDDGASTPRLEKVTGDFTIRKGASAPSLKEVTGDCYIKRNASVPLLEKIGGSCIIYEGASVPNLKKVGGDCLIYRNTSVPNLIEVKGTRTEYRLFTKNEVMERLTKENLLTIFDGSWNLRYVDEKEVYYDHRFHNTPTAFGVYYEDCYAEKKYVAFTTDGERYHINWNEEYDTEDEAYTGLYEYILLLKRINEEKQKKQIKTKDREKLLQMFIETLLQQYFVDNKLNKDSLLSIINEVKDFEPYYNDKSLFIFHIQNLKDFETRENRIIFWNVMIDLTDTRKYLKFLEYDILRKLDPENRDIEKNKNLCKEWEDELFEKINTNTGITDFHTLRRLGKLIARHEAVTNDYPINNLILYDTLYGEKEKDITPISQDSAKKTVLEDMKKEGLLKITYQAHIIEYSSDRYIPNTFGVYFQKEYNQYVFFITDSERGIQIYHSNHKTEDEAYYAMYNYIASAYKAFNK